ncbi:hypothetical protein DOTSEDRAFT_19888 [Dothistroma septosporum NZE10]|uniref:Uncharacterized protein n=1 Tax=Dothistroma septosporum (strain NZE10 / CBS 128990) TaxID=675120 RepID=N1Q191_DOTSN|nr:hypothetical protein DOTSEDRAFT_19888 [Dothistroma septosporum NZE10]
MWLLTSNAFLALLMPATAALRYWASRRGTKPGSLAILALRSFAESGQIQNTINVAMPELDTTMFTAARFQPCPNQVFFQLKTQNAHRRSAISASMMAGCSIGASIVRYSITAATRGISFVGGFFFDEGMGRKNFQLKDGKEKVEVAVTPVSKVLWGD